MLLPRCCRGTSLLAVIVVMVVVISMSFERVGCMPLLSLLYVDYVS